MELTQLGAVGIMGLVCLVLARVLAPLLEQSTATQKLLLTRLKESDNVLDKNTAAMEANATASDKTIAALEKHAEAFGNLKTASMESTVTLQQAINNGSEGVNKRLDTQSAQLTEIADLLRETKNALDKHTESDTETSRKIGRVLELIEQLPKHDATIVPAAEPTTLAAAAAVNSPATAGAAVIAVPEIVQPNQPVKEEVHHADSKI